MVRSLIRFIAIGMLLLGVASGALAFFDYRLNKPAIMAASLGVILFVVGAILLALSGRIADRLTDDFE